MSPARSAMFWTLPVHPRQELPHAQWQLLQLLSLFNGSPVMSLVPTQPPGLVLARCLSSNALCYRGAAKRWRPQSVTGYRRYDEPPILPPMHVLCNSPMLLLPVMFPWPTQRLTDLTV